jgi:hypothetical protein
MFERDKLLSFINSYNMDMQRHMLTLTCGFSCPCMWMGERNKVVTLGRDRFR